MTSAAITPGHPVRRRKGPSDIDILRTAEGIVSDPAGTTNRGDAARCPRGRPARRNHAAVRSQGRKSSLTPSQSVRVKSHVSGPGMTDVGWSHVHTHALGCCSPSSSSSSRPARPWPSGRPPRRRPTRSPRSSRSIRRSAKAGSPTGCSISCGRTGSRAGAPSCDWSSTPGRCSRTTTSGAWRISSSTWPSTARSTFPGRTWSRSSRRSACGSART